MKIHRSRPTGRFTIIPNDAARDPRLSHLARGVLVDILSRPEDWQDSADAMWKRGRHERGRKADGRDAYRSAFIELETCGYLRRVRKRTITGRISTELHVYDIPAGRTDDGTSSRRSDQDEQASPQVAPTTDIQASVPPGQTPIVPGGTDDGTGGMSVPPGQTGVSAGRTDDGTSRRLYEDSLRKPQEPKTGETPETEGQGPTPSPFPNPGNSDGPDHDGSQIEPQPVVVPEGADSTRARGCDPPGPLAPESEIATWQVAESRRQRELAARAGP